jgi:hypothetical protein
LRRPDAARQQHPPVIDGRRDTLLQPGAGAREGRLDIGFDLQIGNRAAEAAFLPGSIAAGTRSR